MTQDNVATEAIKPICGVVMPISAIDNCTEGHWADVQEILADAIEEAGFAPNLVSNADDVGVIQKRIIQNLYDNPVVVCDVSGKNPNVMFELGLRLAFDKPTIIVKDDKTTYSFDTAAIEHLEYPRDLRFSRIVEFKQRLIEKIVATHERASSDENYTTFLKHFGEFKVAKIQHKEVSGQDYILEEIKSLREIIEKDRGRPSPPQTRPPRRWPARIKGNTLNACMRYVNSSVLAQVAETARSFPGVKEVKIERRSHDHHHLLIEADEPNNLSGLKQFLDTVPPRFAKRHNQTETLPTYYPRTQRADVVNPSSRSASALSSHSRASAAAFAQVGV